MFCQGETRYSVIDPSDYQVLCVLSGETRYSVIDPSAYQVLCVLSRRD